MNAQATAASAAAVSIFALAAAAPAAQAATEVMQLAEVSMRNYIDHAFKLDTYWPTYLVWWRALTKSCTVCRVSPSS